MPDVFSFLKHVSFFQDLTESDIKFITRFSRVESYSPNVILFKENDPAHDFYVVMSGCVRIWKNYGLSEPVLLAEQGVGQIFGEMALVDDQNRSATVVTVCDSHLIAIAHKDLEFIMRKRPPVMFSILRSLSQMMRRSNDVFIQSLSLQNEELKKVNKTLNTAQAELLKAERFSNLGKFSSFILHDLRNPIAMIKGYAEMIVLESQDSTEINDYARKIVLEADHVNQFANELLDYSRGDIRLNYVLANIDSIFSKLHSNTRDSFERRQINLKLENKVKELVMIDSERILRVLINLVDNAKKASKSGNTVLVTADVENSNLIIHVVDTGIGMNSDVLDRIFEPFYSNSPQGGTGLGMLIVKNVVESHQGSIHITSKEGDGTDIKICMPLMP